MQTVSTAFTIASTATIRKPIAKVNLLWNDVYVDPTTTASSDDENYVTWTNQVYDSMLTTPHKYTILDESWTLDGTKYLAPSTQEEANVNQFGWYSESVSDSNGDFSTYPTIVITFPLRTVDIIKVVAEPTLNQYPVDFSIYVTDNSIEYLAASVTNNSLVTFEKDISNLNYFNATQIKLVITKWSTANTISKIVEFFCVLTDSFTADDIVSIDLLEEREIRNGSLPIGNISCNEINLTIQNIKKTKYGELIYDPFTFGNSLSPWQNLLQPNRRVNAFLGFDTTDGEEYISIGTFWTSDWVVQDDSYTASVTCRDRMEILRRSTFESVEILEGKTLGYLINYLLESARDIIPLPDLQWRFDPLESEGNTLFSSDFIIKIAWFESDNFMAILRSLVEAGLAQAYMSKNDVLIIEDYNKNLGTVANIAIGPNNYFSKDQPSNTDDLSNIINVNVHTIIPAEELSSVYESPEDVPISSSESKTIHIRYNSTPVKDSAAEIIDQTGGVNVQVRADTIYYPYGATVFILNMNTNSGTFKIRVNGILYSYKDTELVTVSDTDSIFQNGEKTYKYPDNHLVQTNEMATLIANVLLNSYKVARKDLTITWRGNPAVELADTISVPEYWKDEESSANFLIYKNNIKFDGGLQCVSNARKIIPAETTTTTGE